MAKLGKTAICLPGKNHIQLRKIPYQGPASRANTISSSQHQTKLRPFFFQIPCQSQTGIGLKKHISHGHDSRLFRQNHFSQFLNKDGNLAGLILYLFINCPSSSLSISLLLQQWDKLGFVQGLSLSISCKNHIPKHKLLGRHR